MRHPAFTSTDQKSRRSPFSLCSPTLFNPANAWRLEAVLICRSRRCARATSMPENLDGSYWVPGWWDASPDQASDEGAEQGFAATAGVMHEVKETEIQR